MDSMDYLFAPIVPWEGDEPDEYLAPELVPAAVGESGLDDLLRVAQRVLLRELASIEAIRLITAENSNPYFDISIDVGDIELGFWDMYECAYRPIWDWWPEFERVSTGEFDDDEDDDLIEYVIHVNPWTDSMSYSLTAQTSAHVILEAASRRRTEGRFGAADAIVCLMAVHPSTPDAIFTRLQGDSNDIVRELALSRSR